jgi:hypothetical protein
MARVSVDSDDAVGPEPTDEQREGRTGQRRTVVDAFDIEVERERTKRELIRAITSIVVMIIYMAFTLWRERDPGVVVVGEGEGGPEDDWDET